VPRRATKKSIGEATIAICVDDDGSSDEDDPKRSQLLTQFPKPRDPMEENMQRRRAREPGMMTSRSPWMRL
jgi:hypothetical protein